MLVGDDVNNFIGESMTLVDFDVNMAKMVHNWRIVLKISA